MSSLGWLRQRLEQIGFTFLEGYHAALLDEVATQRRMALRARDCALLCSAQDAELVLCGAPDAEALRRQVDQLLTFAARLSRAEVADLAAHLASTLAGLGVDFGEKIRYLFLSAPFLSAVRLGEITHGCNGPSDRETGNDTPPCHEGDRTFRPRTSGVLQIS